MFPGNELADGIPPAPPCTVCAAPVLAEGLAACWRHVESDLGVTYRRLDYWARRGYLRPERDSRSSGIPRRWPAAEVEVARRMARLTGSGIAVERAAVFARYSWPAGEIAPGVTLAVMEAGS
jgi:hypothetical protein